MGNIFNKFYLPAKFTPFGTGVISLSVATLDEKGNAHITTKNRFGNRAFVGHNCYSVSKSMVGLAIGFLFDAGKVKPTDKVVEYLGEYFPEGYDKRWDNVTLDDIFHHKTGADWNVDFDITDASKWPDEEYLHTLFGCKIAGKTGEDWLYSDGNYYILARVFEKIQGVTAFEFLREKLFMPMGFYYDMWAKDAHGHILGGTGLYLRTEDIAKIGMLWLQKGVYNGKRYLSEEWLSLAIAPTQKGINTNYGYGIRRIGNGEFTITGMYNQCIYINTEKKVVCAWHARGGASMCGLCRIVAKLI